MDKSGKKSIWLISKYCRLPSQSVNYSDRFQVKGAYPARGFSILRALSQRDYDCTVIHARHGFKTAEGEWIPQREVSNIDGVRVVSLSVPPFKKAQSVARIFSWIYFEIKLSLMRTNDLPRPDYVVASSLSLLSVLNGLFLRWRFKSKLVFEVRDVWPLVLVENGGYRRLNPFVMLLQLVEWLGYKYSDSIVATMPNLEPHVKSTLGYERKVHCIPMGVSKELLSGSEVPIFDHIEKEFTDGKFIVTYVGSIGVDNALDGLFEAARVLKNNSRIAFKIFGSGDLLERYSSECLDLDNVFFGGAIPAGMVQAVLKRSSLLYFATHPTVILDYGQSLNKIIDYMYSGRPMLASHSGYQSMLNEARCGYFVPAGDVNELALAITRLSTVSPPELSEIGARGRDWLLANRTYETLAVNYDLILNS